MHIVILGLIAISMLVFGYQLVKRSQESQVRESSDAAEKSFILGFVANFFDSLGIGSFAIETSSFRVMKPFDERLLPGTLNVGNALPTMAEALIFITAVKVEPITLISLILAASVGAYAFAGYIAHLSKRYIQAIMGLALLVVALLMLAKTMGFIESLAQGAAIGLSGGKLIMAIVIFFILGAAMSAGVGLFAPAMATVYLLGMSPMVAFPIMMGACAFLMPINSIQFIKEAAYAPKTSLFLSLGGLIGVLIATQVVIGLPIQLLSYLVVVVVVVTSISLIRSAFKQ